MQIFHPQNAQDVFNLAAFVFAVGVAPACAITTMVLGMISRPYVIYKNWWEAFAAVGTVGCLAVAMILFVDRNPGANELKACASMDGITEAIRVAHPEIDWTRQVTGESDEKRGYSQCKFTDEEKAIIDHVQEAMVEVPHSCVRQLRDQTTTRGWLIFSFLSAGLLGALQTAWTCSRRAGFLLAPIIFIGRLVIAPIMMLCCLLALCGAADSFKKIDRGEKDSLGEAKKTRDPFTALLFLIISGIAVFILSQVVNGQDQDVRDGRESTWF